MLPRTTLRGDQRSGRTSKWPSLEISGGRLSVVISRPTCNRRSYTDSRAPTMPITRRAPGWSINADCCGRYASLRSPEAQEEPSMNMPAGASTRRFHPQAQFRLRFQGQSLCLRDELGAPHTSVLSGRITMSHRSAIFSSCERCGSGAATVIADQATPIAPLQTHNASYHRSIE